MLFILFGNMKEVVKILKFLLLILFLIGIWFQELKYQGAQSIELYANLGLLNVILKLILYVKF